MTLQLRTQNGSAQIAPNTDFGVQGIVQNRGQTMLTNIQMIVEYDTSIELIQSSPGMMDLRQSRQLTWTIPSLEPGKQLAVEMIFRLNATSPQSAIRLTARSGEGINAQETLNLNAVPGSGGSPPVLPSTPPDRPVLPTPGSGAGSMPSAANNGWSLLIQPIDSQVNARERAKYSVSFRNNQPQADQNVVLEFQLPQGVQVIGVVAVDGTPISSQRSDDGSSLRLEPIRSLRAGENVGMILELKHDVPGSQILEVTLKSDADPQGVRQQSRINVRPNL